MTKLLHLVITFAMIWFTSSIMAGMVWAAAQAVSASPDPDLWGLMVAGLFTTAALALLLLDVVLLVLGYQLLGGKPFSTPINTAPDHIAAARMAAEAAQALKEREAIRAGKGKLI